MCHVAGTEGTTQGVYSCLAQTTTNIAVTAAHASLPRIDTVVARVQDSAYSGAVNSFTLEVVAGTPNASPVAPTLPANSLQLADIAVAASATQIVSANITDKRSYIGMGVLNVRTFADLPSVGKFEGMLAYVRSEDLIYWCDGSGNYHRNELTQPVNQVAATSNSASITTSLAVIITLPSYTYKAGKAYRLHLEAQIAYQSGGTGTVMAIRKTNTAGAVVVDLSRYPYNGFTGVSTGFERDRFFVVGGSDVTVALCLVANTTANTCIFEASSSAPRQLMVFEAGEASDYPAAIVLT